MQDGHHSKMESASPQCLVVMYHYVRKRDSLASDGIMSISPREFERQLDQLCRQLEPIDWPTFLGWSRNRQSIPRRCFLLTFDDALVDHARIVLPILERRGLRGVFFVPGEVLTKQRMLSAHAIHALLAGLGCETFRYELLQYLRDHDPAADWSAKVDTEKAQEMYHYEPPRRAWIKYLLTMVLPDDLRRKAVDTLFEKHIGSPARWSRHWYLDWEDLVEMQTKGHTIGGHGHNHEPLSRLTPGELRHDMRKAAAVLNDGLGTDLRPFSYPYGDLTPDICEACRDAGFVHAFTTERGWATAECDPMHWPRIDTIYVETELKEKLPCMQQV